MMIATLMMAMVQECCAQGKAKPWKSYDSGVRWTQALPFMKAKEQDRPVLLFRLVGDLDKEGT